MMALRPYVALFRVRVVHAIQYRFSALGGVVTHFAWGAMLILAFHAFYQSNPDNFPMTMGQTVTFIWLQQAFLALFMVWLYDNSIFESIARGDIAYDLVRPMDMFTRWFTTSAANRVSRVVVRCLPMLVIGFVLPANFRMALPGSVWQFGLFAISLVLSLLVVVSFTMLVYISAFYTLESSGTRMIAAMAGDFLAGGLVPVAFFPDGFRQVAEWLPFASMQNTPLMIFVGAFEGADATQAMLKQLMWIGIMVGLGRLWMGRAMKRVITQGG